MDFSLRRTQGIEAGMHAARSGALVGFAATSNVAAAHEYGLRATATMAHSFVEACPTEAAAFATFARTARGPVTLLVDTYNTEQGVHRAVDVLCGLAANRDVGVRLDSGDLAQLARRARQILDDAGLRRARIVASGGLDEYSIEKLVAAEAPIDTFAVGSKVGTAADAPYLDAAYKLVDYAGRSVMKLSAGKATLPGAKQVFRGRGCTDILAVHGEQPPEGTEPLLDPVLQAGRRCGSRTSAAAAVVAARHRFHTDIAELPDAVRAIHNPEQLHPLTSCRLRVLSEQVRQRLEIDELAGQPVPGVHREPSGPFG